MHIAKKPSILCLASYFKGQRFLQRCCEEGWPTYLLTVESLLREDWPRESLTDIFALPTFADRRALTNAIAYLMREIPITRLVALDDFDVEVAGFLRDHFRLPGFGESTARLFRDKLAMRTRAAELSVLQPPFTAVFHRPAVADFLARVSGPWLLKPRSQASAAGIRRLSQPEQVWQTLDALGDDAQHFVLEKMVPGDVYHVDSLVADGQVVFAEVNGYRRPLLEVYHDGGIYATRTLPRQSPEVVRLREVNEIVLTGFGLRRGASHTEFLRSHADGSMYFIETSARVGGANTAEMVEAATGINLWSEWAKLELDPQPYSLPPTHARYGGVIMSLARQEWPDTSAYQAPEIVKRVKLRHHVGFVFCADTPEQIDAVQSAFLPRIAQDFAAVLPPADRVAL